jgi:hypothetical protein
MLPHLTGIGQFGPCQSAIGRGPGLVPSAERGHLMKPQSLSRVVVVASAVVLMIVVPTEARQQVVHRHGAPDALTRATQDRGAAVMGFDQEKTTHHFLLHPDGGTIDISVDDLLDQTNLQAIRLHLKKVEVDFGRGDFSMPHAIHAPQSAVKLTHQLRHEVAGAPAHQHVVSAAAPPRPVTHHAVGDMSTLFVPGAATMSRLKTAIRYRYEETTRGGRIAITTANADAVAAIHEFLRYQITEHRTGDPGKVVAR